MTHTYTINFAPSSGGRPQVFTSTEALSQADLHDRIQQAIRQALTTEQGQALIAKHGHRDFLLIDCLDEVIQAMETQGLVFQPTIATYDMDYSPQRQLAKRRPSSKKATTVRPPSRGPFNP